MELKERVVTTISVPPNKVKEFMVVKQIIEEQKLGSMSSLFMEFLTEKYRELTPSCSLEYFTPKLNAEAKHKKIFLLAIKGDSIMWDSFGKDIQEWINHYNTIEQGRIYCL